MRMRSLMKKRISLYLLFLLLPCKFCLAIDFTFSSDTAGWEGDFSDYPVGGESFYELAWGWENLPTKLTEPESLEKGLFLSGNNHSDDLFMFVRRKMENLKPDTEYLLNLSVLIESNIPTDTFGVGGSEGESVYLKIGASTEKPEKIAVHGFYQLSVDKGDQSEGGKNSLVVGTLAHEEVDPHHRLYLPKLYAPKNLFVVKSNSQGEIWIFLGTDSGYESRTKFYIAQVTLQIEPL